MGAQIISVCSIGVFVLGGLLGYIFHDIKKRVERLETSNLDVLKTLIGVGSDVKHIRDNCTLCGKNVRPA